MQLSRSSTQFCPANASHIWKLELIFYNFCSLETLVRFRSLCTFSTRAKHYIFPVTIVVNFLDFLNILF